MLGVFIDAENINNVIYLEKAISIVSSKFDVKPKYYKAYADWTMESIREVKSFCIENGISCHQTSSPNKKNASDIELMFDVYELLDDLSIVVIISNDSDFTHISEKILNQNKQCINIRRQACHYENLYSEVIYLDNLINDDNWNHYQNFIKNFDTYSKELSKQIESLNQNIKDTQNDFLKYKQCISDKIDDILTSIINHEKKINDVISHVNLLEEEVNKIANNLINIKQDTSSYEEDNAYSKLGIENLSTIDQKQILQNKIDNIQIQNKALKTSSNDSNLFVLSDKLLKIRDTIDSEQLLNATNFFLDCLDRLECFNKNYVIHFHDICYVIDGLYKQDLNKIGFINAKALLTYIKEKTNLRVDEDFLKNERNRKLERFVLAISMGFCQTHLDNDRKWYIDKEDLNYILKDLIYYLGYKNIDDYIDNYKDSFEFVDNKLYGSSLLNFKDHTYKEFVINDVVSEDEITPEFIDIFYYIFLNTKKSLFKCAYKDFNYAFLLNHLLHRDYTYEEYIAFSKGIDIEEKVVINIRHPKNFFLFLHRTLEQTIGIDFYKVYKHRLLLLYICYDYILQDKSIHTYDDIITIIYQHMSLIEYLEENDKLQLIELNNFSSQFEIFDAYTIDDYLCRYDVDNENNSSIKEDITVDVEIKDDNSIDVDKEVYEDECISEKDDDSNIENKSNEEQDDDTYFEEDFYSPQNFCEKTRSSFISYLIEDLRINKIYDVKIDTDTFFNAITSTYLCNFLNAISVHNVTSFISFIKELRLPVSGDYIILTQHKHVENICIVIVQHFYRVYPKNKRNLRSLQQFMEDNYFNFYTYFNKQSKEFKRKLLHDCKFTKYMK